MVVKRLVSIEDLGNIVVLFTDKTGTPTEGHITFASALDADGRPSNAVLRAWVFNFNAHTPLFRSGWFVESLVTQSLIIFAIRTHRVPFFHSTHSTPLAVATMICVTIGVLLPFSPLAHVPGFVALPASFLATLAVMIVIYLVLVELGKLRFYRLRPHGPPVARRRREREHWIHHRATRWSIPGRPRRPTASHQT